MTTVQTHHTRHPQPAAVPSPGVRITPSSGGDVLVERLQPSGRWLLRRYRKDGHGFITEVRPNGSCFPVGPGLKASLSPLQADGPLADALRAELRRE